MDTNPSAAEIGHRIRRAREALRLTQQQLADRLEVSVGSLRTWEQGLYRPSNISRLEEALQVSLVPAPSSGTPAGPRLDQVGFKRLLAEADSRYSALEDQLAAALAEVQRLRTGAPAASGPPGLRIAGEKEQWAARHDDEIGDDPEDSR